MGLLNALQLSCIRLVRVDFAEIDKARSKQKENELRTKKKDHSINFIRCCKL